MLDCFSPLENLNLLIDSLVNSNNNVLPLKYINKLLNDLTKSLSESNFYDVEIKVGVNENIKTFKAHSTTLEARTLYFKVALSNNWIKRSDDSIILFEKANIFLKVFELLLMYLYDNNLFIYYYLKDIFTMEQLI